MSEIAFYVMFSFWEFVLLRSNISLSALISN